jgi:hypothetical protein
MTDQANPLAQFSDAIAARVEAATTAVVAIYLAHERHITGMVCSSDVVVTSEQSLPRHDEFEDCRRRLRTLARNASVANDPKRKSRPQANRFSSLNTPNDHRIRVGRGPARHINYRGSP